MSHTKHTDTKCNWTSLASLPFSFRNQATDPFSADTSFQALGASLLTRPWILMQKTIQLTHEQSRTLTSIFFYLQRKGVQAANNALQKNRRFSTGEWSENRR